MNKYMVRSINVNQIIKGLLMLRIYIIIVIPTFGIT